MDGIGLDINSRLRAELEHKISELRLLGAQDANLAEQAANLEREHHALLSSTTATRITAPKATCTRGHISTRLVARSALYLQLFRAPYLAAA